jgi:hypothetical protein
VTTGITQKLPDFNGRFCQYQDVRRVAQDLTIRDVSALVLAGLCGSLTPIPNIDSAIAYLWLIVPF